MILIKKVKINQTCFKKIHVLKIKDIGLILISTGKDEKRKLK